MKKLQRASITLCALLVLLASFKGMAATQPLVRVWAGKTPFNVELMISDQDQGLRALKVLGKSVPLVKRDLVRGGLVSRGDEIPLRTDTHPMTRQPVKTVMLQLDANFSIKDGGLLTLWYRPALEMGQSTLDKVKLKLSRDPHESHIWKLYSADEGQEGLEIQAFKLDLNYIGLGFSNGNSEQIPTGSVIGISQIKPLFPYVHKNNL